MTIDERLHEEAVEEVKKKLEKELGIQLVKSTIEYNLPKIVDLICDSPDQDLNAVVSVCDNVRINQNGKISEKSEKKLFSGILELRKLPYDKKILVITDPQAYIKFSKTFPYFQWHEPEPELPEIKLIEFPIFQNNFVEGSNNKEFTVGQLILAMKFNVINYDQFPSDVAEMMFEMLNRRGYLRKKPKKSGIKNGS
tara:strand:+ start:151 stop:738 length:588 start_codon:yes stop_codon:yes gene_type:complete